MLFVDGGTRVLVNDFGTTIKDCLRKPCDLDEQFDGHAVAGTYRYMPRKSGKYETALQSGERLDVYALAVSLVEFGLDKEGDKEINKMIVDLLNSMMELNFKKRPDIAQVIAELLKIRGRIEYSGQLKQVKQKLQKVERKINQANEEWESAGLFSKFGVGKKLLGLKSQVRKVRAELRGIEEEAESVTLRELVQGDITELISD